jgi:P27 family predicted phage terminase small subunit
VNAGRPRKTDAQHKADGTRRPDRQRGRVLPVEVPATPPDLKGVAEACWNVVSEHLRFSGAISKVDGHALRLLCESWSIYVDATDAVREHGVMIAEEMRHGAKRYKQNPAVEVRAKVWKEIVTMLRQFGLTPASRTAVQPGSDGAEDNSSIEGILGIVG